MLIRVQIKPLFVGNRILTGLPHSLVLGESFFRLVPLEVGRFLADFFPVLQILLFVLALDAEAVAGQVTVELERFECFDAFFVLGRIALDGCLR